MPIVSLPVRSMRSFPVAVLAVLGLATCTSDSLPQDGGADSDTAADAEDARVGGDRADGEEGDVPTGCTGAAPNCFGNDVSMCCGNDPSGTATCEAGTWKCDGAAAPGCSGTPCLIEDMGSQDLPEADAGCTGTAPNCFGNDVSMCCGNDPSGQATCEGGAWMCGAAAAPGCNGTSCLAKDAGGNDPAPTDGGCTGSAPNCFGNDVTMCCGNDPSGTATCEGGTWMCGAAVAPGCNGTSCV